MPVNVQSASAEIFADFVVVKLVKEWRLPFPADLEFSQRQALDETLWCTRDRKPRRPDLNRQSLFSLRHWEIPTTW